MYIYIKIIFIERERVRHGLQSWTTIMLYDFLEQRTTQVCSEMRIQVKPCEGWRRGTTVWVGTKCPQENAKDSEEHRNQGDLASLYFRVGEWINDGTWAWLVSWGHFRCQLKTSSLSNQSLKGEKFIGEGSLKSSLLHSHIRSHRCAAVMVICPDFQGESLDSVSLNKLGFVTHPQYPS